MTIKAIVEPRSEPVGHSAKVGYASRVVKKKTSKRKIRRASPMVPMALQELFVSCKEVFKGPGTVPSPADVKRLCDILDKMQPEDFGLSAELQFFKLKTAHKVTPKVTYTTIYKCDKFSMCIFFLPAKAVIPLHNHPEMTVFSKLLLGAMHVKSYDWVNPSSSDIKTASGSGARLATIEADSVFTAPCNSSVLYPTTGGNIHQFTAITPCAFLDVLGPPYSKEDGRDCSYYKEFPYTAFSNGEMAEITEEGKRYGWLEETEMPKNSEMDGIEYLGPQVQDDDSC